jgi:hypothetical protein
VALGGALEPGIGVQRALAVSGPFAVDQAEGRRADQAEVVTIRFQPGVGARAPVPAASSLHRAHDAQAMGGTAAAASVGACSSPALAPITGLATV